MNSRFILPFALLGAAGSSFAIVIRHDRDDAKYRALGDKYKSAICVTATGGHGTLIDKQWVLTAAHVVDRMNPLQKYVTFGDKHYRVKSVHLHPSWALRRAAMARPNDIALVQLEQPVEGIKPVKLYEKSDEAGKKILFVGTGMTGDGNTGPTKDDRLWRAAENVIESVGQNSLSFKFDAPPAGSELEGISGPGDSGGPALLEIEGDLYVLGTSSDNSSPRGQGHCTYNTTEFYGRVSTARSWIRETMASPTKSAEAWPPMKRGTPSSELGKIVTAYIEAINAPDLEPFVRFTEKHWTEENLKSVPADERKARAERTREEFGKQEVLAYSEIGNAVVVLVRSSKAGLLMQEFRFTSTKPPKYEGLFRRRLPFEPEIQ